MNSHQADTFFPKPRSKGKVKFVALKNFEIRKAYAYHVPNLNKKTLIEIFNNWLTDIPDGQYPGVISSDLGSEFHSKDFYKWLEDYSISTNRTITLHMPFLL